MSGLRERLLAEGERRGLQKSFDQGVLLGKQRLVIKWLSARFGPLDEATLERLETASSDELDLLADKALDANSLEEALSRS